MLSDFVNGIMTRLQAADELDGITILLEDPEELETQIEKAISQVGMLILVGQARWNNTLPENQTANMLLTTEIAIGEAPSVWRSKTETRTAADVAGIVTAKLQGFKIRGFRYISMREGRPVPDRKRQIYEVIAASKWIVDGRES